MRIDCQSHLFCPEIVERMQRRASDPRVFMRDGVRHLQMGAWMRKIPSMYFDVDAKLAAMDKAGITLTALSINDPGPEWFGAEGPEVARIANDFIIGLVQRYPNRFFGLCVLPLQDMSEALTELERCAGLGMKGILLYTNLVGHFPDEPVYRPMFARAAELGLPVLLHPAKPVTTDLVQAFEMTSSLGNMFEDTMALTRIIMSGLLDEYPTLQLVCPHLGGTLPFIIGRLDHQTQVLKRGPKYLRRKPSDYLRQVWLDVVSPLPLAIKFCRDLCGVDRLLYASDHPWVEPSLMVECLEQAGLSAAEREQVFAGNARRLFRLE